MSAHQQPVSAFWWLHQWSYLLFVLRELSSVFVAWFVVYLLMLVSAVSAGQGPYEDFLAWSGQGWVLVLNVVALAFVLLHAVTWFALAPRAIVVPRVPPWVVLVAHYLAWAVLSAGVVWVVLR
ncbi:fumarate reductase subunit C [Lentzea tibetensis]|uniref:Fumarate reductase subunit C n=1 Tax=Lentzea tibetensis TaxID=2591470 RepID=A0A563ERR8_9PSEU|nr:fumarate reductase subunit C [Lentzea tibetensis]TWP50343.1 fumarate reductase subunit C [Lentzea tibetensis]